MINPFLFLFRARDKPRDAVSAATTFLETRKFQVSEICRIYRVPPHMIGDLEHATFSNIEHQSIDFAVHCIRPWLVRIEQSINRSLFTDKEKGRFYCQFNLDGLMRGSYNLYCIHRTGAPSALHYPPLRLKAIL